MQNQAVQAYQQTAQTTAAPRDLEAMLLSKAATGLQRIRNNWDGLAHELPEALLFNRKLWSVFLSSAVDAECQLPHDLREQMANLGVFVMCQTMELQVQPEPEKLDSLININRELAVGLRTPQPA